MVRDGAQRYPCCSSASRRVQAPFRAHIIARTPQTALQQQQMPELNRIHRLLKQGGGELGELVKTFEETIVAEGTAKLRGLETDNTLVKIIDNVVTLPASAAIVLL